MKLPKKQLLVCQVVQLHNDLFLVNSLFVLLEIKLGLTTTERSQVPDEFFFDSKVIANVKTFCSSIVFLVLCLCFHTAFSDNTQSIEMQKEA